MKKFKTLHDLFVHELKDLHSAERQLLKALPKMAKAATNAELKDAFESHLRETETHVERLDTIFEELAVSPRGVKCAAMEGLVEEGSEVLEAEMDPEVKDAALICAAQRVEHYEMAGYGCVRTFANLLGLKSAEKLLQATLDEEQAADEALTGIATSSVNTASIG